jgi:NitT/TauT family transport system permease protein
MSGPANEDRMDPNGVYWGVIGAAVEGEAGAQGALAAASRGGGTGLATRLRWRRRLSVWGGQILLGMVIVGGWQWFTAEGWVDKFFFGQPTGIAHRLYTLFRDGTSFGSYPRQIFVTFEEAVYGFLLGAVVGIVFGVALGMNRYLSDIVSPYIKMLNAIPRIVLGAIFVVAFGVGLMPKVILAAVLVFFVVFFNAFQGVREVDPNVISNARVLGAKRLDIVRHVTLPSAMTWIIASLHTAFGFAIVGALVQEILGSTEGLGLVISTAQGTFDANGIFAVVFTVMALTLVAEFILTRLEHQLLGWRPQSRSDAASI